MKSAIFILPKITLVLLISIIFSNNINSQIQSRYNGNSPVSRIQNRKPIINKNISLSNEIIKEIHVQDSIETGLDVPFRFGWSFKADIDFLKESKIVENRDTVIHTYEIKCRNAISINLIFDQFILSDNSTMNIYNSQGTFIYGPITSKNNPPNGVLWSDIIKGDQIVIELIELKNDIQLTNKIHISNIIFGYRNILLSDNYGESLDCENDIACPEGDDWRVEANAVNMLLVSQATALCSGCLLNNTANDLKGYLLTAFHCLDRLSIDCSLSDNEKSSVNNWLFISHYESPSCDGPDYYTYITINGANFRAAYQPTDFALLELTSVPALATYAGWNRSTSPSGGVGIHHPIGDVKKISFAPSQPSTNSGVINWTSGCSSSANTHWIMQFTDGPVEHGSSGSPFFDINHRVIGQLHAGDITCPNPTSTNYYGRFDQSWTGGGSNDTRLSNWLDPTNSGVSYLDRKISISSTLSGPTIVCSGGTAFTVNNVPAGDSIVWECGPHLTRVSNQGANPCTFASTSSGDSWIRVSIQYNNSKVTLPQHTVWAGQPILNHIQGPFPPYIYKGCTDQPYTFYADPARDNDSQSTYQWLVEPGYLSWDFQYQYYDWVTIVFNDPSDYYQVITRASNTCGNTDWKSTYNDFGYIQIMDCDYFSIYPNPASDYVTITMIKPTTDKNSDNLELPSDYRVQIIDNNGKSYYSANKTEDSFIIPVGNLKDGRYFVHIIYGKKVESLPLIIKR